MIEIVIKQWRTPNMWNLEEDWLQQQWATPVPILSAQKRKVNSQATIHRLPKPGQQKIRTTFLSLMSLDFSCNRWSDGSNGQLRIWCKHASILPVSTIQAVAAVMWGSLSCSRSALVIYHLFSILQDQKHPRGDFWIQIQMISLIELVKWLYKKLCLLINTNSDEQFTYIVCQIYSYKQQKSWQHGNVYAMADISIDVRH